MKTAQFTYYTASATFKARCSTDCGTVITPGMKYLDAGMDGGPFCSEKCAKDYYHYAKIVDETEPDAKAKEARK